MIDAAYPPIRPTRRRRRSRGHVALLVPVLALGAAVLPRLLSSVEAPPAAPAAERFVVVSDRAAPPPVPVQRAPVPRVRTALFEPAAVLGAATPVLASSAPLASDFVRATPAPVMAAAPLAPRPALAARAAAVPPAPQALPARLAEAVPLPVPRPPELRPQPAPLALQPSQRLAERRPERLAERLAERPAERLAERPSTRRARIAIRQEAEAEQSFFDAVFGSKPAAPEPASPQERPTALAYAATGRDAGIPSRGGGGLFEPRAEGGTAIYDITARTVTLPSGEVLEAHSGLGKSQDNPRDVHIRMRGATPPGTYTVTEREALFHGVRALRLTPVGGSGAIHGRDGILAHTYMLGPSGASNGCVVFRNYDRFLQAYLRGEFRRLVVVAGSGDSLASGVARLFGRSGR